MERIIEIEHASLEVLPSERPNVIRFKINDSPQYYTPWIRMGKAINNGIMWIDGRYLRIGQRSIRTETP